jgi:hypothetical protein
MMYSLVPLRRWQTLRKMLRRALPAVAGLVLGAAALLAAMYLTGGRFLADMPGFVWAPTPGDAEQIHNSELIEKAYAVLDDIKNGDYGALARSVHPEYGVIFSPYATISLSSNKCFTSNQVADFETDANAYVWGVYDGSGDPIEMTPAEYFARFVYNKDFSRAPAIGVNYVVRSGNALENITEVFPDVRFVEFHSPGDDKNPDSHSWNSLRLGFEEYAGALRLTVILHSEWTV